MRGKVKMNQFPEGVTLDCLCVCNLGALGQGSLK